MSESAKWPFDDLTSEQILVRAIMYVGRKPKRVHGRPRWSLVGEMTGHGSGYSRALCIWAGCDPDERLVK